MSGRLQQLIAHHTADPRVWFRNWRWRATSRILALPFILRAFPNAHIVHVTHDGRDCLRSAWSNKKVPQQSLTVRFARFWAKCVNAGLDEEPNPRVHRIGYEAFTTHPTDQLRRIMQGIGLWPEDQQLDPEKRMDDQRAGQDAIARLGSAISPATVGAWRKALDSKQKTDFVRIAGDTLERLGYPRQ